MTAMLGKTPTAFIRGIRVNHAVQLIQTTSLTMTEVAEQSGFSSASYMAKCFQEDLGKNPSELKGNQP
jgi:transcriptional regulator GlxA family with amidase domain